MSHLCRDLYYGGPSYKVGAQPNFFRRFAPENGPLIHRLLPTPLSLPQFCGGTVFTNACLFVVLLLNCVTQKVMDGLS